MKKLHLLLIVLFVLGAIGIYGITKVIRGSVTSTARDRYAVEGVSLVYKKNGGDKEVLVSDVRIAGITQTASDLTYLLDPIAEPEGDFVYFVEDVGDTAGRIWAYHKFTRTFNKLYATLYDFGRSGPGISPDQKRFVMMGPRDEDGEIRSLYVVDFVKDHGYRVGGVSSFESYIKMIAEFDGSPVGEFKWSTNDKVRAKIFSPAVHLADVGDTRTAMAEELVSVTADVAESSLLK